MNARIQTLLCVSVLMLFVTACDPAIFPEGQFVLPTPAAESQQAAEPAEAESAEPDEAEMAEAEMAAPSLELPAEGTDLSAGTLALSGAGEPGSQVQVLVNEEVVGEVEVNNDGNWSLEAPIGEAGEHQVMVQTVSADGTVASMSEPVMISIADGEISEVVTEAAEATEEVTEATEETAEEAAAMAEEAMPPTLIFPSDGADVLTGQLTLIGSGTAGTEVEIMDGAEVLGTAEVNADGEWTYTLEPAEGEHQFAARLPGDATTSAAVQVNVSSDPEAIDCDFSNPGVNRGDTWIVGTCDTFNDISKDLGVSLEELKAANPEFGPDFDLVYPGQTLTVPE